MQHNYRRASNVEITIIILLKSHWCSPVNLLHIFSTPFPKNTSEGLLLKGKNDKKGISNIIF